jgi:type I restriction enzyme R subunit
VLYKEALDKYLPPEYSVPVYTPAHNDKLELKKHYLSEDKEKEVRKAFLKPTVSPKILIVTEKLLTGFDAPILYCMYLDKPMRDHTLLQAIARVNRPYELEGDIKKPAGFVIDFVGIFDKLEKALAFDSEEVSAVIQNIDVLKQRFKELMDKHGPTYLDLAKDPVDDKTVEGIIERFVDKTERERFSAFFKEVESLYEIISPDAFLADYIKPYQQLAVLYEIMKAAFEVRGGPIRDLMNKTEELVRKHVVAEGLAKALPVYEIDEKTVEALRKEGDSGSAKVVNLARSLAGAVREKQDQQPHLIPIGDRAASILELFEDRQLSTVQALRELEQAIEEYNAAQREMRERGFDIRTFSVYWVLRRGGVKDAVSLAPVLEDAFRQYPNHRENSNERRDLKAELYKILLRHADKGKRPALVDELLRVRKP